MALVGGRWGAFFWEKLSPQNWQSLQNSRDFRKKNCRLSDFSAPKIFRFCAKATSVHNFCRHFQVKSFKLLLEILQRVKVHFDWETNAQSNLFAPKNTFSRLKVVEAFQSFLESHFAWRTEPPRFTGFFPAEEYTKIQTPRQEVIFKKSSLDRKRDSLDLGSTPSSCGSTSGGDRNSVGDQGSVAGSVEDPAPSPYEEHQRETSSVEHNPPYEGTEPRSAANRRRFSSRTVQVALMISRAGPLTLQAYCRLMFTGYVSVRSIF